MTSSFLTRGATGPWGAWLGGAVCLTLASCGGLATGGAEVRQERQLADGGALPGECLEDVDCGAGLVCEGCAPLEPRSCVVGCRADGDCRPGFICKQGALCARCPCASGYCDRDPCRDDDGDGFTAAPPGVVCRLPAGDCDDFQATLSPAGPEVCANGQDDDCDGRTDQSDSDCRVCATNQNQCGSHWHCGAGTSFCDRGCCERCPARITPGCQAGFCPTHGGVDPATGCARPDVCRPCHGCDGGPPVCTQAYATLPGACAAARLDEPVLHAGACRAGEGLACPASEAGQRGSCAGLYCRRVDDAGLRCTQPGVCVVDADCPAGLGVSFCADGGLARLSCSAGTCLGGC